MFKQLLMIRSAHIVIDGALLYASFLLAYGLQVGWIFSTDFPFPLYAQLSAIAAGVWLLFLMLAKYYRIPPRSGQRVWFDILLVILGGIIANGFLIVSYFFPRNLIFSRQLSLYIFIFGLLTLFLSQWIVRTLLARRKRAKIGVYRTLIIGANGVSEKLIQAINDDSYALYEIVGVLDPYGLSKEIKGSRILGKLDQLEKICTQERITAIIQCDAFEHTLNVISLCEEKDIKFQFDPSLRGIYEENLRIREVAGATMISFVKRDFENKQKQKAYQWGDKVLRQVFDVD